MVGVCSLSHQGHFTWSCRSERIKRLPSWRNLGPERLLVYEMHSHCLSVAVTDAALRAHLFGEPGSSPEERRVKSAQFVLQSVEALMTYHAAGVLVGDIKPGNMLYDTRYGVVHSDLGHAQVMRDASLAAQLLPGWGVPRQVVRSASTVNTDSTGVMERCSSTEAHLIALSTPRSMTEPSTTWCTLADFADLEDRLLGLTVHNCYVGTAPYSAPESVPVQHSRPALRGFVGTFTDVYSLGVSLLEILAGVRAPRLSTSLPSAEELRSHQPQLLQALAQPLEDDGTQAALLPRNLLLVVKNMVCSDVRRRSSLAEVAICARQSIAAASEKHVATRGGKRVQSVPECRTELTADSALRAVSSKRRKLIMEHPGLLQS